MKYIRNQLGFTLFEVVIVITLISILSYSVVSSFTVDTFDIDQVSRQVESGVNYARFLATSEGHSCGVIAVTSTSFRVYCNGTSNAVENPHTQDDMLVDFAEDFPDATFSSLTQVEFNSYGALTTGSNPVFTFISTGHNIKMYVETNTGNTCLDKNDAGECS